MQKQPKKITIQSTIENTLKKLNIQPNIEYSGRTDRGVHALNQLITFYLDYEIELEKLKNSLNRLLPSSIYIKKLKIVPNNFHPRFDAKKRSYIYLISPKIDPFIANYTLYYPKEINLELLKKAIKEFEGEHDFSYFAKTGSDINSYIRIIYKTDFFRFKNYYVAKFVANGFLRSQIRIMLNFLLLINEKKATIDDLKKQLEKKELFSKHLASPNGLYLQRIWI